MSLKRNIIANYIGQIYTIGIGIVITPLYLQYLGAEPYGLVGIFALMQAWMSLLDVGISPTFGRQAAVMRGHGQSAANFWALLKSFEAIFMGLAVLMVAGIFMASHWLAQHWINVQSLELGTVIACLQIMGVLIGLRWFAALYRSGINGLEDQVWLNAYNISIISLKFLGALVLVATISNEILHFFIYQLAIGCLEVMLLMWRFYSRIDKPAQPRYIGFEWAVVKSVMPYAMGIAYTSAIWTLTTQTDKLIFSKVLPLAEFGYFTLVALVAGGITLINSPIVQALNPRMTYLYAKGENEKLITLYRDSSQITAVIALCVASMVGLYAQPLLFAWTGDQTAAAWGADVLFWFALGNAVMLMGAYPYYMQKAMGKLKWHVIGSTLMAALQVPIIYWAATTYGAVGAGKAWLIFLSVWFVLWTPFLHRQLIPGLHLTWLLRDILPVLVTVLGVLWLQGTLFDISHVSSRLFILLDLVMIGLVVLITCSLSARLVRNTVVQKWKTVNA
jgi:O-antigen/teichoic acid export membrane protein